MSDLAELVVAFEPSSNIIGATETLNAMLKRKWADKNPIILKHKSALRTSVAHMTITHLRMSPDRVHEVAPRIREVIDSLILERIYLRMNAIETVGQFVFWNPDLPGLALDNKFEALTTALLDGKPEVLKSEKRSGSPAIESICSLRAANFEPQEWWPDHFRVNNDKYGHPGVRSWHITVGYVREGLTVKQLEIPPSWNHPGYLENIIIGKRGPNGTISEVITRIPLPT